MKAAYLTVSLFSLVTSAWGLDIDPRYVAAVIGPAIGGSFVLGFIKPEKTWFRQITRGIAATISSLIVGMAIVQYRELNVFAYVSFTYFMCSILSLIAIQAVMTWFQNNAGNIITTVIESWRVKPSSISRHETGTPKAKRKRGDAITAERRGIHISEPPNPGDPPTVIIDPNAKPDEVKVIRQQVVETKKDGKIL